MRQPNHSYTESTFRWSYMWLCGCRCVAQCLIKTTPPGDYPAVIFIGLYSICHMQGLFGVSLSREKLCQAEVDEAINHIRRPGDWSTLTVTLWHSYLVRVRQSPSHSVYSMPTVNSCLSLAGEPHSCLCNSVAQPQWAACLYYILLLLHLLSRSSHWLWFITWLSTPLEPYFSLIYTWFIQRSWQSQILSNFLVCLI